MQKSNFGLFNNIRFKKLLKSKKLPPKIYFCKQIDIVTMLKNSSVNENVILIMFKSLIKNLKCKFVIVEIKQSL